MAWKSTLASVMRPLGRFGRDSRANIAVTFSLATLPIIGVVGAAVDFSHANSVKVALQAALDSTALVLAKNASTMTNSELQSQARTYFAALFNRPEAINHQIRATYTTSGGSALVVTGSVDVPTTFMEALGYDSITVGGSSTTRWGSSRLRVALALDVTGSMSSSGKMDALKTATKSLLAQLRGAAERDGDVYVSIIPFNKNVNVGSSHYNADWIDWSDWEDDNGEWEYTQSCSRGHGRSRRGRSHCSGNWTWQPANHSRWNGCITDRDKDYDQLATAPDPDDADLPSGRASTLFPAEQYGSCPVAMKGLSYDWTGMERLVDSMRPAGNTNQPIGLVWAWQSLVGGGPLIAPAKDPNYKYTEIVILLSDGMNTENRWHSQQTPVDNRMYQTGNGSGTCANIKAAGITIYTLQVNTGQDPTSTLLRNCASKPENFYLVTRASDISTAFSEIGSGLTKLRVAR